MLWVTKPERKGTCNSKHAVCPELDLLTLSPIERLRTGQGKQWSFQTRTSGEAAQWRGNKDQSVLRAGNSRCLGELNHL